MPCLNARRFLEPRIASLQAQTCSDWQAIVLDSESTDGSWELFEQTAALDPRFHLHRVPREGLYAALNRGIDLARGEFLAIATCDDTMAADFLAAMLAACAQTQADLAVCDLEFIGANGLVTEFPNARLGAARVRTPTLGEELEHPNLRRAPHDSLLHFSGDTVYYSLTQLLVRTELARRAPRFETVRGSYGDFGWTMNLTNLADTVHVPRKLATWRFHGDQLSSRQDLARHDHIPAMCLRAVRRIYHRHHAILSRHDCAALLIPTKILLAQTAGRRGRQRLVWLEGAWHLLHMFIARPTAFLRAVTGVRFRRGYLKQAWIAFILRALKLQPQTWDEKHDPLD